MFLFEYPWFACLLPLPLLVRRFALRQKKTEKNHLPELSFPALNRIESAFGLSRPQKAKSKSMFFLLLFLIWTFLIIALMQPEKVDTYHQVKNKGYDLMLAVDVSGSMQALDFSTSTKAISRLDVTKEVVSHFVQERQGDRVGLIVFGENAYLLVPLTLDTHSVSKMLNDTVSGMAGNATAIGDAIGLSVRTLRERPEESRVLILLTDGDDNSSKIPPLEAARLAKQYGIRIYTIGIGKNGSVPFPNQYGSFGFAETPLDEKLLKEIAALTQGQYFRATEKHSLESIYAKINQLEKSEADDTIFLIRDPLYAYPLGIAIGLLLLLTLKELLSKRRLANDA